MVGGAFRGFLQCSSLFFFRDPFMFLFYVHGVVHVPPTALDRSEFSTVLKSILFI